MSVEPTAAPDAAALMQARAWLESADRIMVLTGVMSKLGVYGFLRLLLPIFGVGWRSSLKPSERAPS